MYPRENEQPLISTLPQGMARMDRIPKIKKARDSRAPTDSGVATVRPDTVSMYFAYDLDAYPALVGILNHAPAESLSEFVRREIVRWTQDNRYIPAMYDLSYKPAHIIEAINLRVNVSRSTRKSLQRAARKYGYTQSALLRVLVERKVLETELIFGV